MLEKRQFNKLAQDINRLIKTSIISINANSLFINHSVILIRQSLTETITPCSIEQICNHLQMKIGNQSCVSDKAERLLQSKLREISVIEARHWNNDTAYARPNFGKEFVG